MTRLTKDIKNQIATAAIDASFKDRSSAQKKASADMGMELYDHVFDVPTRRAAAKLPRKWLRYDGCLRFNCGGYNVLFHVNPSVPVPNDGGYCSRLGDISGELAVRAQAVAQAEDSLKAEREKAGRALLAMLDNISSISQLEKTWPEGEPFYRRFKDAKPGASLPAVQVSAINAMLGLEEAA